MIICISGKSGVGKDTIIDLITSMSSFRKYPACTTRLPREGEVDGIDYRFLDDSQFIRMEEEDLFLDHLELSGRHYGLPKDGLDTEEDFIVNLNVESGLLLKEFQPKAILVFLRLPSRQEQFKRLVHRGMSDADITKRLSDEHEPNRVAYINYDLVLINNTNQQMQTVQHILHFIKEAKIDVISTEPRYAQEARVA